jgi:hypothetical protein
MDDEDMQRIRIVIFQVFKKFPRMLPPPSAERPTPSKVSQIAIGPHVSISITTDPESKGKLASEVPSASSGHRTNIHSASGRE